MEIIEVTDKKRLRAFIRFPYGLYRHELNYAPEPAISQAKIFSRKNPFFEHSEAKLFLAMDDKKVAGRIAAIHNRPHNRLYREKTGFFGFFEVQNDYEIFVMLIEKVIEWAKAEGFNRLMGPANFTTNDSCGFLISGFDRPPIIHMPYNMDYYPGFFERYGFLKATDLFSYSITAEDIKSHLKMELLDRIEKKLSGEGISIRTIRFRELQAEIRKLADAYNEANANNWGFIPLTEKEFSNAVAELKLLIPEKLILLAEKNDELIGFLVALPDYNQVFRHIRSGRLLPFGLVKFYWYKRKISRARILILGVLSQFKNRGIDILMYKKIQENVGTLGITNTEAAYVMENNKAMNSILMKLGGSVEKKYRIYLMNLD